MSTIASLLVNLGMNTAAFEAGTKRARRSMNQMASEINASASRMTSLATAAAGIFVGTRAIGFAKQQMEAIDKTAKLSDALGISTEQLVGFQRAAELAGPSADVMNKSIQYLAKNLGEAMTNGGAASKAFQRLGLDAQQLASGPLGEAFLKVAQAISELPTPAEQASAAMQLFSRSGIELLPLLAEGRAGIEEVTAALIANGEAFSRMDAAKVEAANDALTNMKGALSGALTQALVSLAPMIVEFAAAVSEATRSFVAFTEAIFGGVGGFIKAIAYSIAFVKITGVVSSAIVGLVRIYKALAIGQGIVNALMSATGTGIAAAVVGLAAATASITAIEVMFSGIQTSAKQAAISIGNLSTGIDTAAAKQQLLSSRASDLAKNFKTARDYMFDLDRKLSAYKLAEMGWSQAKIDLYMSAGNVPFLRPDMIDDAAEKLAKLSDYERMEKLSDAIRSVNQSLDEQFAVLGRTSGASQIYQLQILGASHTDIALLQRRYQEYDRLERKMQEAAESERRLASIGQRWFEATRTPLERFAASFDDINDALKAGVLSFETWWRASEEIIRQFHRETAGNTGEFRQIENSRIDVRGMAGDTNSTQRDLQLNEAQVAFLAKIDAKLYEILRNNGLPL